MVAEVIINSSAKDLNKIFDYNVPTELVGTISVGNRVLVDFGNRKQVQEGYVIGFKENSDFKLKDIIKIEQKNSIKPENIELARLMARKYFCNISDCIKLMLPPGTVSKNRTKDVNAKFKKVVCINKEYEEIEFDIENNIIKSEKQIRILDFLKYNNETEKQELIELTETSSSILKTLEKNGYIQIIEREIKEDILENKKIKTTKKLVLNKEQEVALNKITKMIDEKEFKEFLIYGVTGSRKN